MQSDPNKPKNIYGRVVPENEPCNQLMLKLGFSKAATGFCFGSLCVILYELNKGQFWNEDTSVHARHTADITRLCR
jgi:hypothetical protein